MDLMKLLPWNVYHDQEQVADFQGAIGSQLAELLRYRDDLYLQFRLSSASWGMAAHEADYGIPVNPELSLEQRKRRWRAKRQGRGTTKSSVIEQIASDFTGLRCQVVEFPEEDRFELWAYMESGIPALTNDLIRMIEEIKPAHLGVYYCNRDVVLATLHAASFSVPRIRNPIRPPAAKGTPIQATMRIGAVNYTHTRHIAGGVTNYG